MGADDRTKLSSDKADLAAGEGRYQACFDEVAQWAELWSRATTLAPPKPRRRAWCGQRSRKCKAVGQPAIAEPAEEDAAAAVDAPSQGQ